MDEHVFFYHAVIALYYNKLEIPTPKNGVHKVKVENAFFFFFKKRNTEGRREIRRTIRVRSLNHSDQVRKKT